MEKKRSSHASLLVFTLVTCLISQNLVIPVISITATIEDQKNHYSPDPHSGTPPTDFSSSLCSHRSPRHHGSGGGGSPHSHGGTTPSHGGTTPSHGGGGSYNPSPSPPSGGNCGGGGSPPYEPSPTTPTTPSTPSTPTTPSNPPSGGGGGYYNSPPPTPISDGNSPPTPSYGGDSPPTPITVSPPSTPIDPGTTPPGGGGGSYNPSPSPPSGGNCGPGGSPPYEPSPTTPTTPSTPSTPTTPSNPPSGGGGGYYNSPPPTPIYDGNSPPTPSYGGDSPPTPITVSPPSTPTDPGTTPPGGGGGYYNSPPPTPIYDGNSPPTPSYGGDSPPTPITVSPPSTPIDPGTTPPTIPSPPYLPSPSPFTGTCNYWRNHPGIVWGLLGWWGTLGNAFGVSSVPGFGANLSLPESLSNTRNDGYGALYREGTASFLNSLVNDKFPYSTKQVRDRFAASLNSNKAAATQAHLFRMANEGRMKPRV